MALPIPQRRERMTMRNMVLMILCFLNRWWPAPYLREGERMSMENDYDVDDFVFLNR